MKTNRAEARGTKISTDTKNWPNQHRYLGSFVEQPPARHLLCSSSSSANTGLSMSICWHSDHVLRWVSFSRPRRMRRSCFMLRRRSSFASSCSNKLPRVSLVKPSRGTAQYLNINLPWAQYQPSRDDWKINWSVVKVFYPFDNIATATIDNPATFGMGNALDEKIRFLARCVSLRKPWNVGPPVIEIKDLSLNGFSPQNASEKGCRKATKKIDCFGATPATPRKSKKDTLIKTETPRPSFY